MESLRLLADLVSIEIERLRMRFKKLSNGFDFIISFVVLLLLLRERERE